MPKSKTHLKRRLLKREIRQQLDALKPVRGPADYIPFMYFPAKRMDEIASAHIHPRSKR